MSKNVLKGIFVKVETPEGELRDIHISDLDKEDYEYFLDFIDKIRILYESVKEK